MNLFNLRQGQTPLILSMPHSGTEIPQEFAGVFVSEWRARKDTDWHIPALYQFASALDATIISANISRSVIDLNRDPTGISLYPGQTTTGLCPTETFDGEPLYVDAPPDAAEIEYRRALYFMPYHAALRAEIIRLRRLHDTVTLYDCHSIRSEMPRLFTGRLPHFNIGSNDGKSCPASVTDKIAAACDQPGFSHVVNGRFKGGYITRHYGDPQTGVHAVQMELACRGYLDEPAAPTPENWPADLQASAPILPILRTVIEGLLP